MGPLERATLEPAANAAITALAESILMPHLSTAGRQGLSVQRMRAIELLLAGLAGGLVAAVALLCFVRVELRALLELLAELNRSRDDLEAARREHDLS